MLETVTKLAVVLVIIRITYIQPFTMRYNTDNADSTVKIQYSLYIMTYFVVKVNSVSELRQFV